MNQEQKEFLEIIHKKIEEVKDNPEKAKEFILSLNLPSTFRKKKNKLKKD